jgi:hypothetical protein
LKRSPSLHWHLIWAKSSTTTYPNLNSVNSNRSPSANPPPKKLGKTSGTTLYLRYC